MDPEDYKREVEEVEEGTESLNEKKCCTDCNTTRTPLWRGGPAGPKSLCNACGIKYDKKRRAKMRELDKNGSRSVKNTKRNGDLKLKVRLMVTNHKQPHHNHNHHHNRHHDDHHDDRHRHHQQQQKQKRLQRKRSSYERGKPWWNKLREEEQAAILLMAISCGGSLY